MEPATWIALAGLVLSTAVNIALIVIGRRDRKADAQRAYVEFSTRQHIEIASELLFAIGNRVYLIEHAYARQFELKMRDPRTKEYEICDRRHRKVMEELLPEAAERINRALAGAQTVLSKRILDYAVKLGHEVRVMLPSGERESAVDPYKWRVSVLGEMIREELLVSEVHEYKKELFRRGRRQWVWKGRADRSAVDSAP